MTNREPSNNDDKANRHLEESISSGQITPSEAEIIRLFFASPKQENWPASSFQRRMRSSGG
jgi:hypothetical protein